MPVNRQVRNILVPVILATVYGLLSHGANAEDLEVLTNSIEMKLIAIPAGDFKLGSEESIAETLKKFPGNDPRSLEGELPQRRIKITKPFYLGQYEVTLSQFLKFRDDANYKVEAERDREPSWGHDKKGELLKSDQFRPWEPIAWTIESDHPAIYVSWNDAVAFCEWLSKKEDRSYRLPTEAEWEYACRAGTNHRYSFGDDPDELTRHANANDADRKNALFPETTDAKILVRFLSQPDGYVWTAPVGKFQPNAFGLYDMHGNVWEWCSDWYDKRYYAKPPRDDPKGPNGGTGRVLRGGGYDNPAVSLRCAIRGGAPPSSRSSTTGFRVACDR